jgi:hypothetical protein
LTGVLFFFFQFFFFLQHQQIVDEHTALQRHISPLSIPNAIEEMNMCETLVALLFTEVGSEISSFLTGIFYL